ncbi:putative epidermal cell surface receptor isoform X6 [Vespa crabro]|uniref:putative epidermal cell surface receptor isoform X6 n=1 Tax=Vespa crabro TaxID=7445 RepID=UPI001F01867F|nr:putative epidermal cell surface receptor isoform X6 [Vespa crabro]
MRIQKRCFLCTLAGLCLLGLLAFPSSALDIETIATTTMTTKMTTTMMTTMSTTTATNAVENENISRVEPLETRTKNETFNSKTELLAKEADSKVSIEAKKKSVVDFKSKVEQKYQKLYKEDEAKSSTALVSSSNTTESRSSNRKESTAIPLLFRGEVIAGSTMRILDVTDTSTSTEGTTEETTTEGTKITEESRINEATSSSRGRALNVSRPEPTNSLHANLTDLSDVSMDEDDKEVEGGEYVVPHNETVLNVSSSLLPSLIQCTDNGRTYSVGEKIVRDCEEKCTCKEGGFIGDCRSLCISPYVRAGRGIHDPLCEEKLVIEEPCCALLVCAADSAPEPEETCILGNKTISRGQRVVDGCTKICICEAGGNLKCQPRCPPNETTSIASQHDRCVELMDPRDSCCTITLCDVTLGDHEIKAENSTDLSVNLTDVKVLNSTAIKLKLSGKNLETVAIEISDNNHVWRQQKPDKAGIISNLEPARTYYVRVTESGRTGPAIQISLPAEVIKTNVSEKMFDKNSCSHRGKSYKLGAEWYDECISFCMCAEGGKAECVTIQCPTDFGLDVLDPHCLDWETVPANFVPKAPQCCPQEVRCRNNGSCNYEGVTYDNWSELPSNVTGCEKRCYCEMGNVSCQAACPPVPALPPVTLQCPSYQAALMHLPGDECCLHWVCGHPSLQDKIKTTAPTLPGKPKQGQRNPEQEIAPDELYHLINIQHPGLIQLDHGPPQGHSGIYNLHQQIATQKRPSTNQIQTSYFGTPPPVAKKTGKPHIFTQKSENGQTTYHIHTPDIPNTPQQIEELLAHISQHDPNLGPFQHYPGQPAIPHNIPTGPQPSLPLHIDAHIPHSGLTHLNHPFAAQTPNQSGLDHNVPPGFPLAGGIPNFPVSSSSDEVTVQVLEALDESTVRLVFTVPTILVGLHGRVELKYTSDSKNFNPTTWKSKVFAPPGDLIATPQLEFELDDLKPSTEYKVKITVKLKDLTNSPTSKIYSIRTLEKQAEITTLPPQIPIDAELQIMETNSSWINIMWKKFTDYELQFIDGVQLRYKEHDGKVYAATPLIHRAVTNYVIENLKPMTTYEIGIYFIPFPGQATELVAEKTIHVTTSSEPDPYSFDVKVEIKTIKSTDVEISWSGVPYPEDKYVNIYRAIYQSDSGKEDTSTFKIAKRDSPAKTIISDLKPGTRYRLWIEVYLTNGRIKKSNVQDFVTKPGILIPTNVPRQADKLASIPLHEGDYYGPLVIVAIVASLAILSTLILLMMLMKRRTSSKADISPRKTTSAYDNPSYKTYEDVTTITNGKNKNMEHELATINSNVKGTA